MINCKRSHPGTLKNKRFSHSSTTVKPWFYECRTLSDPLFFLIPTRERLPKNVVEIQRQDPDKHLAGDVREEACEGNHPHIAWQRGQDPDDPASTRSAFLDQVCQGG